MTREQLEKANNLSKDIEEIDCLVRTLDLTLETYESEQIFRPRVFAPFLRLLNCRKKSDSPKEANIILFQDKKGHDLLYPIQIPVDTKVIELLRDYFSERLKGMEAEFEAIGQGEDI